MIKYIKEKWYLISIKNKQLIFYGIIIFLVSLISFYSQQNTYRFMNNYNDNMKHYYAINRLFSEVSESGKLIETYLRNSSNDDLEEYLANKERIFITLLEVEDDVNSLETYLQVKAIKNSLESYFEINDYATKIRDKEDYYIPLYQALKINDYIKRYIQKLLNISVSEGGWYYNNELVPRANSVRNVTFISIIGISVLCLFFALVFSNYLTKPIRKLASSSIKMSKGDLDIKEIGLQSKDEVGILADSFTKMHKSIRQMLNDLKEKSEIERMLHEEEIKNVKMSQLLKEAEFLGLQSQINPHFLFNTLNTIARTSMFENASNTTKLIQCLSDIFRYNLESQSDHISLLKELEITNKYMYIQQYRFGNRLKFNVRCNIDLENIYVPRFTLQPLVENSIIHGIEPREGGGCLRIRIFDKDERIIIRIIDNGTGIPSDRINQILSPEKQLYKGHTTGIGLSNVRARLNSYLNTENCFKIFSKEGIGTIITIELPIKKGVDLIV